MAKRVTPWKEDKIISIETRKGVFVLAQMLKSPYLRFYNAFREDENWGKIDVSIFDTLFTNAVTSKQFLKLSNISVIKEAVPDNERDEEKNWIKKKKGSRTIKVWGNTEYEKEFIILGSEAGGNLVEIDIWKSGIRAHPSGVIDAMILEDIPLNNSNIIDKYELTALAVYPSMNERLYLCYKMNKNINPAKDLAFDREIPMDYKVFIEIMSIGEDKEEQERILDTYFR